MLKENVAHNLLNNTFLFVFLFSKYETNVLYCNVVKQEIQTPNILFLNLRKTMRCDDIRGTQSSLSGLEEAKLSDFPVIPGPLGFQQHNCSRPPITRSES